MYIHTHTQTLTQYDKNLQNQIKKIFLKTFKTHKKYLLHKHTYTLVYSTSIRKHCRRTHINIYTHIQILFTYTH